MDETIPIDQFPRFFEGTKLNFAENILCKRRSGTAIISMGEENLCTPESYTWQELRELVRQYADALKASGIKKGDIVASSFNLNIMMGRVAE